MSPHAHSVGRALLYLTTEVEREVEVDFGRWSEAHARDNLGVPGFRSARRFARHAAYRGLGPGASYLTIYALRDAKVLDSEAYLNRGNSMPAAFSGRFQFERSLFRALDPPLDEAAASPHGPAILRITVDVDADYNDAFLEWYVGVHVPAVVSAPGMLGARRYVRIEAGSDVPPSTGKIRYLTIYEMEEPGVVSRPETLRVSEQGACPDWLAPHRTPGHQVYDEIFSADA